MQPEFARRLIEKILAVQTGILERYLDTAMKHMGRIPGVILLCWEPPYSQGHAHALNLRDSGVKDVTIALRKGSATAAKAEKEGLKGMEVAEAAKWADVIMMLTPDELQADIYRDHLHANMKKGAALMFALQAKPSPPTSPANPSETMSPNMLPATITP